MNYSPWICCQLGAREHYAIPRALHRSGQLACLITDAWVPPQSLWGLVPLAAAQGLRDRYHPDLVNAAVASSTNSLMRFEIGQRLRRSGAWNCMIARNHWFQQRVIHQLIALQARHPFQTPPILFTYSYAALDILRYAKSQGWYTVLGQIDPGPIEEAIVIQEQQRYPDLASWQPVPPAYWENWQAECGLADRILVNSDWSRQALQQAGIAAAKITVLPLVYDPPATAQHFQRTYPTTFSTQRPLRVLFLGQAILRKGIAALLDAAKQLEQEPIEFWIVGRSEIVPTATPANIRWIGPVPRSATATYYQQADIFLFPTLSDGFGLTQLEAQAWKLPLIASPFCGAVVQEGVNGRLLPEVSGNAIATILQDCLRHPEHLAGFAQESHPAAHHSLAFLSQQLQALPSAPQLISSFRRGDRNF